MSGYQVRGISYSNQTIQYPGHGDTQIKIPSNLGSYMHKTMIAIGAYLINGGLDKITLGSWGVASLFPNLPNTAQALTGTTHHAYFGYDVYEKTTYVTDNGEKYVGAVTENAYFHFQNRIETSGNSGTTYIGEDTPTMNWRTKNYNSPNSKAASSYLSGGWIERLSYVTYGDTRFSFI